MEARKQVGTWLGKVFPYIGFLEREISELRVERRELLDRLIRLTTGWGMDQSMPDIIETQREADEMNASRKPRTAFDLARELERLSMVEAEKEPKEEAKN
jgi:hypothetical protein